MDSGSHGFPRNPTKNVDSVRPHGLWSSWGGWSRCLLFIAGLLLTCICWWVTGSWRGGAIQDPTQHSNFHANALCSSLKTVHACLQLIHGWCLGASLNVHVTLCIPMGLCVYFHGNQSIPLHGWLVENMGSVVLPCIKGWLNE